MTQTICRMYASPETARAAAEELQEFRQLTGAIHVVHPTSSPDATIDETRDRIAKCNVLRKDAQVLARGVLDGNSLVVVHAPLFSAELVEECLDQHQPTPGALPTRPERERFLWDEAAPLSSAFRLPTISSDPAPFSSFWNLPVLKAANTATKAGMETIRFFSQRPDLFSGLFGLRMSSKSSTPFSNFFGLPLVSNRAAPFSAFFKLPTLIARKDQ
ncbi:MAG: hypothetical protein U1E28_05840 [Beijerinckiaceae bacterium]